MPSVRAVFPCSRSPLFVIVVVIIAVLILRAFLPLVTSDSSAFGKRSGSHMHQVTMLTYNIWFSPERMRERMEALGEVVQHLKPDIMSFQEVTLANLAVLKQQSWFSKYHLIPQNAAKITRKSFVVILSVYPVGSWFIYTYKNSPRKRILVVAETENVALSSVRFVIAGTHLAHAGNRTRLRELQLKEAFRRLSDYGNVCVMGDLNIEDKVDGDIILPSPWVDGWLSLPGNSDKNGLTWDRSKTPFTSVLKRAVNATSYRARLDRVLCKLKDFKVKEMKVVGDKLTKSGILPSDHFGLYTVLEFSRNSVKQYHTKSEQEVYFKRPPGWEKLV